MIELDLWFWPTTRICHFVSDWRISTGQNFLQNQPKRRRFRTCSWKSGPKGFRWHKTATFPNLLKTFRAQLLVDLKSVILFYKKISRRRRSSAQARSSWVFGLIAGRTGIRSVDPCRGRLRPTQMIQTKWLKQRSISKLVFDFGVSNSFLVPRNFDFFLQ